MWLNKERMVFGVMIAVLVWRVVEVVNPAEPESMKAYSVPRSGPVAVPQPPPTPRPQVPPPTAPLTRANPFWYHANPNAAGGDGESGAPDLTLMNIQNPPAGPVAMIRAGRDRARSLKVGDEFATYQVMSIDVEAETVTVYDESTATTYTIGRN